MEHLEELKALQEGQELIDMLLKSLPSLGFSDPYKSDSLRILDNNNGRYTLSKVIKIIGMDEFKLILSSFQKELVAALVESKKKNESEMGKYTIIKSEE